MAKQKTVVHDTIVIINQKKRELAIFSIFTLTVTIVLLVFAVRPMLVTVVKINSELKRKEVVNVQLAEKISNLSTLRNDYYEFEDDLEDLTLIFPNNWDFSLFVTNVEEVVKENNFYLMRIGLSKLDVDATGGQVAFQMLKPWSAQVNVIGREENLIHLFEALESLPMYCTIDSLIYKLDLEREYDEDARDIDLIEYSIYMRVYYVDDPGIYTLLNL